MPLISDVIYREVGGSLSLPYIMDWFQDTRS